MKKLFNHTKRPDRNWEEDVQDGYDWDEEQDGGEKSARDPVTKATVSDIIKNIRDR